MKIHNYIFGLSILFSGSSFAQWIPNQSDITYNAINPAHNTKIYISSARHADGTGPVQGTPRYPNGERGECRGRSENYMSYLAGLYVAAVNTSWNRSNPSSTFYYPLRQRGYTIRVGRASPGTAATRANNWGASRFIALHSNAKANALPPCNRTVTGLRGATIIFQSWGTSAGQGLSELIKGQLKDVTPGSTDYICHLSSPCTQIQLTELLATNAVAAYSETEFHDWNLGSDFLSVPWNFSHRIAEAIDAHVGYPGPRP